MVPVGRRAKMGLEETAAPRPGPNEPGRSPHNMALRQWEDVMPRTIGVLAAIGFAAVVHPATAADVTPERLLNTAKEPQNWLMVHRDYDNSRHSPLSGVDRANVKDLKLKFLFSIGGRAPGGGPRGGEERTPPGRDAVSWHFATPPRRVRVGV